MCFNTQFFHYPAATLPVEYPMDIPVAGEGELRTAQIPFAGEGVAEGRGSGIL